MTDNPTDDPTTWPLAAYGTVIVGDETTSQDQVANAMSPAIAERLVACWNACKGVTMYDLQHSYFREHHR
jgi:hypothetical protein